MILSGLTNPLPSNEIMRKIPYKHAKAIRELYKKNGVGRTVEQRFAYWEAQNPDGYSISHSPTTQQKVWVFEMCWLTDHFPQDFIFC
jgi:hypothetical protein